MLGVKTYPTDYIRSCRGQFDALLAAYDASRPATGSADHGFEALLCQHLALVLDMYFVHRIRAIEGKDGNPLNEVRMLSASVLTNGGVLGADRTIKYRPDHAVLRLAIGDPIRIDRAGIERLADAYFAEIVTRFT